MFVVELDLGHLKEPVPLGLVSQAFLKRTPRVPQVGEEVKHRDQPRMRDESTAASTDASNTASPGLDAAEPLTPREQVIASGVRAADSAHEDSGPERNQRRRNANTNRHSGLSRLPR